MPASAYELIDGAAPEMAIPVMEKAVDAAKGSAVDAVKESSQEAVTEAVKETAKEPVAGVAAPKPVAPQESAIVKPAGDTKKVKHKRKRKHRMRHSPAEIQTPVVAPVAR